MTTKGRIINLTAAQLMPSPLNPRKRFDEDTLRQLATSIEEQGILQNLIARPSGDSGDYVIAAGERRWRAVNLLIEENRVPESFEIPVRVKQDLTDLELLEIAVSENIQRKDVTPIEESEGFHALLESGLSVKDLSMRFDRSETYVRQRLALAALPDEAKQAVDDKTVSLAEAALLSSVQDPELREDLAARLLSGELTDWQLKGYLNNRLLRVKDALFDVSEYKGTITNNLFDPEHEPAFEDHEQAVKLQVAAMHGQRERLKSEWAFVEDVDYLSSYDYVELDSLEDDQQEAARKIAGALILENPHRDEYKIREGVIKRSDLAKLRRGEATAKAEGGDGAEAPSAPDTSLTKRHTEESHRQRTLAIQNGILGDPWLALRLAIIGMIDEPGDVLVRLEDSHDSDVRYTRETRGALASWVEYFGGLLEADENKGRPLKTGGWDPNRTLLLYHRLRDMEDGEVLTLFATLIATKVGSFTYGEVESRPLVHAIAEQVGATPPNLAELDVGYMKLYRKARVLEIAAEIGMNMETFGSSTQAQVMDAILSTDEGSVYVPEELRFKKVPGLEATRELVAEGSGPADSWEDPAEGPGFDPEDDEDLPY